MLESLGSNRLCSRDQYCMNFHHQFHVFPPLPLLQESLELDKAVASANRGQRGVSMERYLQSSSLIVSVRSAYSAVLESNALDRVT